MTTREISGQINAIDKMFKIREDIDETEKMRARIIEMGYDRIDEILEQNPESLLLSAAQQWFSVRRLIDIDRTKYLTTKEIFAKLCDYLGDETEGANAYGKLCGVLDIECDPEQRENKLFTVFEILHERYLSDIMHHLQRQDVIDDEVDESSVEGAIDSTHKSITIDDMITKIVLGEVILNPPWQRGDVWNIPEKRKLIQSVFRGIPIPSLLLLKHEDGNTYALDGKQRLTTLHDFRVKRSWSLPNNWTEETQGKGGGFTLRDCNNDKWDTIPTEAKKVFNETNLSYIEIKNIDKETTAYLFNLYNSTGQPLKQVELRNALYHRLEMHQMLFEISGEQDEQRFTHLSEDQTNLVTSRLQAFKKGDRFETLELTEKYLGYLRSYLGGRDNTFKALTAEKAAWHFWEHISQGEDPIAVANEIHDAIRMMAVLFDTPEQAHKPRDGGGWERKKYQQKFITSLIISHHANLLYEHDSDTFTINIMKSIVDNIGHYDNRTIYGAPPRDNAKTLWDFQAKWVTKFIRAVSDETSVSVTDFPINHEFIEAMESAIL